MKLFAIIAGTIILTFALTYCIFRVIKSPKGWHFSKDAIIRYWVSSLSGIVGGICLILFGVLA